nr:hypothetical protein [Tanacetum cinerariifolium]
MNIYAPKNKAHYESEKEAIHLILTGIGDEIYSTVDACKIAQEMWEAIKRLQQGKSLNIQDVKTNLFWEFGEFTSHDGETMESYYTRFYKLMNKLIRNNLTVATISYAITINKGKEIAKPIIPPSESASEEDIDPEQAQRDKDMKKNLALIRKTMNVARARKNTDEEIDEQELEAHYSYMAKIQEVPTTDSSTDYEPLEQLVAPPSLDYVPRPEHPPSPDYVPGLKDQPLPVDASPITASPNYVADSDPEEDPEDDQANYPADGGDGDDEPSDDDDDDDDTDDEDPNEEPFEDEEEEEHLAPADSYVVPIVDPTRLRRARKTVRPEPPMLASMEACIARHAALPSPPLLAGESFAAGVARQPGPIESDLRRYRVEQTGFGITDTWDKIVDTLIEIASTTLEGVDQRVTELDTTKMKPKKRTTRATPATKTTPTTTDTNGQLQALIDRGVAAELADGDADRSMNGDNNNDLGTGERRQMSTP